MDIIALQNKMELLIESLAKVRDSISELSLTKANRIATYEKELAKTMIMLQNGQVNDFDGVEMCKVSVTNAKDIAKGICWRYKLNADLAESEYRAAIVKLETMKAELNGYQSIYKYSEYSTK